MTANLSKAHCAMLDSPRRRRWPRFAVALPALAGLCVAAVIGCGSPVTKEHAAAISKIQELGGKVNFKRGGYEIDLVGTPTADDDLACLKDISNLKSVDLRGTTVTDAGLAHIQPLTTLEFVNFQRTRVTFEAAEALRKAMPNTDVRH